MRQTGSDNKDEHESATTGCDGIGAGAEVHPFQGRGADSAGQM